MKPVTVTGTKREIADTVSRIDGVVREAIVFVDDPAVPRHNGPSNGGGPDLFAEMDPFTVQRPGVEDSRDAIYRRGDGERSVLTPTFSPASPAPQTLTARASAM